jgi:hypothetical protein
LATTTSLPVLIQSSPPLRAGGELVLAEQVRHQLQA